MVTGYKKYEKHKEIGERPLYFEQIACIEDIVDTSDTFLKYIYTMSQRVIV